MKVSAKMDSALNAQVNAEMYSAYLYQSMSAYFEANDLPNMAHWMSEQAKEEMEHAFKIYNYLFSRGNRPVLAAIAGPETDWKSPLAVFEQAQKHEIKVSAMIKALMDLAIAENDYATRNMLDWFVNEQVEEETNAARNVYLVKLATDPVSMHLVDKEFANRS